MNFLVIFVGGGLGAAMRHAVNLLAMRALDLQFPYGTLFINVSGSLLMGVVAEIFALHSELSAPMRLFLTTGILGGYTTFSAFSLETALLYERGELMLAIAYAIASLVLSVGALFLGMAIVRLSSS